MDLGRPRFDPEFERRQSLVALFDRVRTAGMTSDKQVLAMNDQRRLCEREARLQHSEAFAEMARLRELALHMVVRHDPGSVAGLAALACLNPSPRYRPSGSDVSFALRTVHIAFRILSAFR